MVDLKKYNYFTGDKSSVAFGVSDIVKFLDLAGHNYVLFTPPKPTGSSKVHDICLYHYLDNKIEFNNIEDFKPKVGFKTRFNVKSEERNFLHLWEITEVDPFKKIVYK